MSGLHLWLAFSGLFRPLGRMPAELSGRSVRWPKAVRLGTLVGVVLIAGLGPAVTSAVGAPTGTPTGTVDLGQASTYAVLSGASVGNTVSEPGAPYTTLRGDLGVKANSQPTGFPPGVVTGATRVGNPAAALAHTHLVAAYNDVAARPGGTPLAGDLATLTLEPGLYSAAAAISNTGTVTLDGKNNPDSVFVFKIGGALTMAVGARVTLINGASASRIFWQVNGAAAVAVGARFAGTLMALDAIAMGAGTEVNGRALARNGAVALDSNEFYSAPPVVTINGGASAITTNTTPTISGTTDVEGTDAVTVTISGQTLTATPSEGAWSVTAAILANNTYPVVASVTDGAGNPGRATQELTVDTVLPEVTIDGGAAVTTNDATPTITGTSDVAAGTIVRVAVDSQTRSALVESDGTWNVTPSALTDGTRTLTATVTDPAGNPGSDSQQLTVDTTAPEVTIAGGATALTNDATPDISGTAAVPPDTTVTVTLADETLTGLVASGGTWSVTASALSDGPHRVVMSVSDAAGNSASSTQTLTVDTKSPVVAITGGDTATTSDLDPTITGTSDAAPGTTVTVSIAGQTVTTLLQPNGTWNATPSLVGEGTWPVVASVPDPAGNVGSDTQMLAIATAAPVVTPTPTPAPAPTPAPTPTPTPTPTPSGEAATSPAALTTVARRSSQKLTVSVLWIGTKVTAPANGAVVATANGSVKIKGVKKTIKLKRATASIAAGQSTTLKLKPKGTKRASKAALKKINKAAKNGKKITATITVSIVDAAGNTRVVKRTMRLTK